MSACVACAASVKLVRGETMTPPPPSLRLAGKNSSGIVGTPGKGDSQVMVTVIARLARVRGSGRGSGRGCGLSWGWGWVWSYGWGWGCG